MKIKKYIIVLTCIVLTGIAAKILLGNHYAKKRISELLHGVSYSSIENPKYFEHSLRPDYNYPKIILIKFACPLDTFLQITSRLKLISESDTAQMGKEIFLTDLQTKKFFWSMTPGFFLKDEEEKRPIWWRPCGNETYANYFLENPGVVATQEEFDGRICATYCKNSAFFLIDLNIK